MGVPIVLYVVPETNPSAPVNVFWPNFYDDAPLYFDGLGIDPESIEPYFGPVPDGSFGPVVGEPDEWINGLDYDRWINGEYVNPVPCIPVDDYMPLTVKYIDGSIDVDHVELIEIDPDTGMDLVFLASGEVRMKLGTVPPANGGTGQTSLAATKAAMALDLVENIALSAWNGSGNIDTVGTIWVGTWEADIIDPEFGGTGVNSLAALYTALAVDAAIAAELAAFTGNTGITTLGTIGTGVWQGTVIDPAYGGTGVNSLANLKTALALNLVENTALSTWAGSANLTTLGTIGAGTWQGTVIDPTYGGTGVASLAALKTNLSLNNVENTALSTWAGSAALTTVGTIVAGIWNGTTIAIADGGTGANTAAAARTALGVSPSGGYSAAQAVGSVTLGPTPVWCYADKTFADFSAAANQNAITLFTLPAYGVVHDVAMEWTTVFTGGAIATYQISVGRTGAGYTDMIPLTNVRTAVGTAQSTSVPPAPVKPFNAATAVKANASSTGAFLNAATQGVIRFWFLLSSMAP